MVTYNYVSLQNIYIIEDNYNMQIKELPTYFSPEVEVIELCLEGCLASSLEDPNENPEIDW